MKIGCIVMAAGNARRFGSNKLDARVEGKTLLRRALEAVPAACFDRVAVVTQYPRGMDLAREMGFLPVENPRPDLGLSHTIALGMARMQDMDGVMFQVSDQPLLRRDSVEQLVEVYRSHPDRLVALGHDGVRGNPCLFPASLFPELLALEGDHGGSAVIRGMRSGCCWWRLPPGADGRGHTPGAGGPHRRKADNFCPVRAGRGKIVYFMNKHKMLCEY